MKKIILLFGNFTFHHFVEDELKLFKENTEQKALLHSVDRVFECDTQDEVDKLVDEFENSYESWIVPSVFKGEIVYEPEPDRKDFENFVFFPFFGLNK